MGRIACHALSFHLDLEGFVMNQLKRFSGFFLAVMLVSVLGCTSTPTQEGTGEYVTDSWITTKVKAALVEDPQVKATEVNVETFKGEVQLSGFVSSEAAMYRAVRVARGVKGVTSVKNDMRVK
jgi:hyperosmotically inducible protein